MSEETVATEKVCVESLLESNATLEAELIALRRSNNTLRKVNSVLRKANESLRRQQALQVENDKIFQYVCEHGFDASVVGPETGLVESPSVESVVANAEEASGTNTPC